MIRVTIHLDSARGPEHDRKLGEILIANNGHKSAATGSVRGDYKVKFVNGGGRRWKETFVEDFPRKRLLAFDLLYRALKQVCGDRNQ